MRLYFGAHMQKMANQDLLFSQNQRHVTLIKPHECSSPFNVAPNIFKATDKVK